jgi:hypothetical protein
VLTPIQVTADLFEQHPYVTRLYTTMSGDEMTVDPVFDFNPDLGDVSNLHTAERTLTCDGPSGVWRVTFQNGQRHRSSVLVSGTTTMPKGSPIQASSRPSRRRPWCSQPTAPHSCDTWFS